MAWHCSMLKGSPAKVRAMSAPPPITVCGRVTASHPHFHPGSISRSALVRLLGRLSVVASSLPTSTATVASLCSRRTTHSLAASSGTTAVQTPHNPCFVSARACESLRHGPQRTSATTPCSQRGTSSNPMPSTHAASCTRNSIQQPNLHTFATRQSVLTGAKPSWDLIDLNTCRYYGQPERLPAAARAPLPLSYKAPSRGRLPVFNLTVLSPFWLPAS